MARKLIGLTGPSVFTQDCMKVIEEFLQADFVLLYHTDMNNLQSWLKRCDAFMVAGGVDIHPSLYTQNVLNDFSLSKFDYMRDCRELTIIDYAVGNKVPMLGICRGHQLIGVYSGLGQEFEVDISHGHVVHSPHKAQVQFDRENPIHYVQLLDQKQFPGVLYKERELVNRIIQPKDDRYLWVNSFHHQGLFYNPSRKYHEAGIQVLGIAPVNYGKQKRSIIELMQSTEGSWLSCQFHPEYDYEVNTPSRTVLQIFKDLIDGKIQ